MSSAEEILSAREKRNKYILSCAEEDDVISVKANIPGLDKNLSVGYLLVRHFTAKITKIFGGEVELADGADGFCALIKGAKNCNKKGLIDFESESPIGRFVDLDLYTKGSNKSLTRGYMRRCYLCDEPAFVCARRGGHSYEQLTAKIEEDTRMYFSRILQNAIIGAITRELNLENKFGLVTPTSNGSHPDMNYGIMATSRDAIAPYLVKIFWTAFDYGRESGLLEIIRPIGKEAERQMEFANGGVNAYRGLIFVFGVLLAALGVAICRNSGESVYDSVRKICKGITKELDVGDSFGCKAYRRYGITGVRGHAEGGFRGVEQAEAKLGENFSDEQLLSVLCHICGTIEDTVLLKRCKSLEKYSHYKSVIGSVNVNDKLQLKILNDECNKNGLSIGGSADVLAAGVLMKMLRSELYL